MATPEALPVSELRKVCDPESLDFDRSSSSRSWSADWGRSAQRRRCVSPVVRQPGYHVSCSARREPAATRRWPACCRVCGR